MFLGRHLFTGQLETLLYFESQFRSILETIGIEGDFGYEGVVGDHHGHWSEQGLEVVRQVRPAGISRVHGGEDGT